MGTANILLSVRLGLRIPHETALELVYVLHGAPMRDFVSCLRGSGKASEEPGHPPERFPTLRKSLRKGPPGKTFVQTGLRQTFREGLGNLVTKWCFNGSLCFFWPRSDQKRHKEFRVRHGIQNPEFHSRSYCSFVGTCLVKCDQIRDLLSGGCTTIFQN